MAQIPKLQHDILTWYGKHGRKLPWRVTTDPYAILVSEIMLQQTQAERVVPKYLAWLEKYPDVAALAHASTADILNLWSGLGYNRRALNLKQASLALVKFGGFPTSVKDWQKLPGVGPYTAAALCSFAYNQDIPIIDTNVKRFYELIVFGDQQKVAQKELESTAMRYLPLGRSRDWHNALMDISTTINLQRGARAQQEKLIELLPILKTFPLPTVTDAALTRPKQSTFFGSKRYWRGKIIRLLLAEKHISIKRLKQVLAQHDEPCPYDIDTLLADLASDNLIEIRRESIFLPR